MSWKAQIPQVSCCTFMVSMPDRSSAETAKSKPCELFNTPFEVPYMGATCKLNGIASHMTFQAFLMVLSKHMDVQLSLLLTLATPLRLHRNLPSQFQSCLRIKKIGTALSTVSGVIAVYAWNARGERESSSISLSRLLTPLNLVGRSRAPKRYF